MPVVVLALYDEISLVSNTPSTQSLIFPKIPSTGTVVSLVDRSLVNHTACILHMSILLYTTVHMYRYKCRCFKRPI